MGGNWYKKTKNNDIYYYDLNSSIYFLLNVLWLQATVLQLHVAFSSYSDLQL